MNVNHFDYEPTSVPVVNDDHVSGLDICEAQTTSQRRTRTLTLVLQGSHYLGLARSMDG